MSEPAWLDQFIERRAEAEFDECVISTPGGDFVDEVRDISVDREFDLATARGYGAIFELTGRVNSGPIGPCPPGTVLLTTWRSGGRGAGALSRYHFVERPTGWNRIYSPRDDAWVDLDPPAYPPADLRLLP